MVTDELDSLGILRQTQTPQKLDWMTDDEKRFMLLLLEAKEKGIARKDVLREELSTPDLALRLTAYSMAYWERNRFGHESHLVITYAGIEAAERLMTIARNLSRSQYLTKKQLTSTA